jgi:hypothetical protein
MTITPERLAELRTYVTTLWRRCRANPRPEVGEEANLEDLLTLLEQRGMTSAEAGEIYPLHERIQGVYTRQGRAAVCGIPDDSHNCDQMACSSVEHVLARVPHIVDEKPCATCDGEPRGVLIDVVSGKPVKPLERTYGAEWRPCPDCGERKAVVDGLEKLKTWPGYLHAPERNRVFDRAIALLSQEGWPQVPGGDDVVAASDFDAVVQERDQLRKQVEEQKQWMRHKQTCVYYAAWDGTVPPCSCGLSAYLGEG